MKIIALITTIVSSTLFLQGHAQISAIKEGPAFPPTSSSNEWHEVVQNQGAAPIEALYVFFRCPVAGPLTRYDSLFNYSSDREIPPSGSIEIPAGDPSKCTGGVSAAIFSDGHAEGSPEALAQIYDRRKGAYTSLGDSIQLLNAIVNNEDSIQHVVETLSSRILESKRTHTAKAVGYTTVCIIVRNVLRTDYGNLPVPSDSTSKAAPTIEALMSSKNVSRDQARVMRLSQKLGEWRSALENHLQATSKTP